MKFRISKKIAVISAVNLLCFAGFAAFSLRGASLAHSQQYNYAAERWGGDKADEYSQISCFMSKSAGVTRESLAGVRAGLLSALQKISVVPEEGQKLCPDAYSAPVGKATVKGNKNGSIDADITAVGGDFFTIHNFRLIDGAFFADDDLMQDGAVIDKNLAWELYGSYEISGMNITINGTQFYISGVIEAPQTKAEKSCAGKLPMAYISYDGASGFASDISGDDGAGGNFSAVTCYEVLMPDPVKDYAYSSVKEVMEENAEEVSILENSGRFNAFSRLKALKKISQSVVRSNEIAFPYWENASRIVQFRLSYIYLWAAVCLIIPAATAVMLIVKGFKALKRNKKQIISRICSAAKKIKTKFSKQKK